MKKSPRYVLLRHDCPADYRDGLHWDLMLERPGAVDEHRLATWSLLDLPTHWSRSLALPGGCDGALTVSRLPDHRAIYLEYEGPVSNNRGTVRRLAAGAIAWIESTEHRVVIDLLDGDLKGTIALTRHDEEEWRLVATRA